MRFFTIKKRDIANGPGVRVAVFVSGCKRHCPFCFNQVAADFTSGTSFNDETIQEIIEALSPSFVSGLTLLGGEPMEPENQEGVLTLIRAVRQTLPEKSIWLYSGFCFEELAGQESVHEPYTQPVVTPATPLILDAIDVLVDGPFVQELHDIRLRFRGSSNQRLIDMKKTLAGASGSAVPVLWTDDPVFETHTMD